MATIINLDISNKTKVTDYGLEVNKKPLPVINFLIRDEFYSIDYEKLTRLRLRIETELTKKVTTVDLNINNLIQENDRQYIQWIVPDNLISELDKLNIEAIVSIENTNYYLPRFKLILYTGYSFQMTAILKAVESFNEMYALYAYSIKRSEIGQPFGVVPLNSNGKIDNSFMDESLGTHVRTNIYDTLYTVDSIHGLRINRENYQWEYYDNDDDEWYEVNSIHGGQFGFNNKQSSRNIFGGYFTDVNDYIDGGILGDNLNTQIDAQSFNDNITEFYSGGEFRDTPSSVGGGGFREKADPIIGGGFR